MSSGSDDPYNTLKTILPKLSESQKLELLNQAKMLLQTGAISVALESTA
jgi:hypothetical protein